MRRPALPWVALALFLSIGICSGTLIGWIFGAVFAVGVLVAAQPKVNRRRR